MSAMHKYTVPGQYSFQGITFGEAIVRKATQRALIEGDTPEYEVLVATYPRSGKMIRQL